MPATLIAVPPKPKPEVTDFWQFWEPIERLWRQVPSTPAKTAPRCLAVQMSRRSDVSPFND